MHLLNSFVMLKTRINVVIKINLPIGLHLLKNEYQ